MPRLRLSPLARLAARPVQRVEIAPYPPFAVYQRDGQYFVSDDNCSHGAALLSDGELEGYEILCPHHHGGFDVRSGAATRPPCAIAIRCYRASVEGDALYIEVD